MATHRTNRAEIELQVASRERGREMHTRVGALHRERLLPLLDRVCSELSGPDGIDRIDRLELDLGHITLGGFEAQFESRLEAALRAALVARLHEGRQRRPALAAALELVRCHALTGNLPWWADRDERGVLVHHLHKLLSLAPAAWQALLHELADDTVALRRLLRATDDTLFDTVLEQAGSTSFRTDARLLERLLLDSADGAGIERLGQPQYRLRLLQAIGRRQAAGPLAMFAELMALLPSSLQRAGLVAGPQWDQASLALQQALRAHHASADKSDLPPRSASERQTNAERTAWESVADETRITSAAAAWQAPVPFEPVAEPPRDMSAASSLDARERESNSKHEPTTRSAGDAAVERDSKSAAGASRAARTDPHARATADRRRRALSDLDELYVDDAGLVMLWPFIERGFAHAGLLLDPERRFVSPAAQQQGVLLLSWLALEDPGPPEFLLPLAKLLCGLSPEAPCAAEPPLAPACMAEGLRLLAAALAHAQALHAMTVPAFRAACLRRAGVLSVRDGNWLLQVERHPQDHLLDRLPWSWAWLRLPWMPDALQVEW